MVNTKIVEYGKMKRMSYSKINEVMKMPDLIRVQKDSYADFVDSRIHAIAKDSSEIVDGSERYAFKLLDISLGKEPKYDVRQCKERQISYSVPMTIKAQISNVLDEEPGKEQSIYIGEFPLMTDNGTFIINGAERVIVSQVVRSPGAYFKVERDKHGNARYSATVMPNRGAWLEYFSDDAGLLYVNVDKSKKILLTTFLKALGIFEAEFCKNNPEYSNFALNITTKDDVKAFFNYDDSFIKQTFEKDKIENNTEALLEVFSIIRSNDPKTTESAKSYFYNTFFDPHRYDLSRVGRYKYNKKLSLSDRIVGYRLMEPVVNALTGEIIAEEDELITADRAREFEQIGVKSVLIKVEGCPDGVKVISNHMVDPAPFLPEFSQSELEELGINENVSFPKFELVLQELKNVESKEDKAKILQNYAEQLIPRHISIDDIYATLNYLYTLSKGVGGVDDIDHLGNRRIRCVGELLENQVRTGIARMERIIRERISLQAADPSKMTAQSVINARPVMAVIREFFGSSQLSQFMDQNNPLSELTHKRRLSAFGPGGLDRKRAGFEVRDVHYTHYGRMCPIETPEGQNIGLISYIATFARINKYGFIETPYRPIEHIKDENGEIIESRVLDTYEYLTADVEDNYIVVQGNEQLDENNHFVRNRVNARSKDEFVEIAPSRAQYMDITPRMVVSVATSLIPFLENDDANRALMGANMQRQAVPLLQSEPPYVGTGMEYKTSTDSGSCVLAKEAGKVIYVDAKQVNILGESGNIKEYKLTKYLRSNQDTCINQTPVVANGEWVEKGQVIADGPATKNGELSLGKNALIGFMTWEGYNYEDAVLINEKLIQNDVYTSIHIERYEQKARETKLGPEEITREIPNVGEDAKRDLDENGIIRVGAEVKSGDILVGMTSPKGEREQTAEEKLLHAIFGEKAREVRDTSLRVPNGSYGIVVAVEEYTKENAANELETGVSKVVRVYVAQKRKLQVGDKMAGRHGNKGVVSRILPQQDMPFLEDGTPLDIVLNPLGVPSRMNIGQVLEVHLGFACRALGRYIATPVFDGAHESDIIEALKEAKLPTNGKVTLTDGRTGEKFDEDVTVGVMYYLKLHHLVDDKMHARSTGPYSLVTQQPLGGKAQLGGQRFGEMEVWALEAYGAAYTLQEVITYKSDDTEGRDKAYDSIVKGENIVSAGVPESFRVLVKELKGMALNIEVFDENNQPVDLDYDPEDETGTRVNEMPSRHDHDHDHDHDGNYVADEDDDSDGELILEADEPTEDDLNNIDSGDEDEDAALPIEEAEDSNSEADDIFGDVIDIQSFETLDDNYEDSSFDDDDDDDFFGDEDFNE